MTKADSVHSTPPTNTSVDIPLGDLGKTQDSLYLKTPVTPEEVFQAIGRLRAEARAEIDRLIRFLDSTENHMAIDCEPEHEGDDCELEDGGDDEPSLGSHEVREAGAVSYRARSVCAAGEMVQDCEGDEHDGREPDDSGIGDLDGLLEQIGQFDSWLPVVLA